MDDKKKLTKEQIEKERLGFDEDNTYGGYTSIQDDGDVFLDGTFHFETLLEIVENAKRWQIKN